MEIVNGFCIFLAVQFIGVCLILFFPQQNEAVSIKQRHVFHPAEIEPEVFVKSNKDDFDSRNHFQLQQSNEGVFDMQMGRRKDKIFQSKDKTKPQKLVEIDNEEEEGDIPWEDFNESGYIDQTRLKPGDDSYGRNKFNQQASDNTKSNRDVPDTRHGR